MSLQALFPTINPTLPVEGGPALSASDDFEVLALALDAAGLTDTVAGLENATIFAPTDAAFGTLAESLGFTGDTGDANAVFGAIAGALTGLASDGDPIPLLTDILLYHVSPETQTAEDLDAGGPVTTLLDGTNFEVTDDTIVDNDPDAVNGEIVSADIVAGANTIQAVDQVLLPIDTPVENADPTLLNLLEESGGSFDDDASDFDLLLTALQATGLDAAVDDETAELTVFLPTDGAFVGLAQQLGYEGSDEGEAFQAILDASAEADPEDPLGLVTDILTYHVSPGEQDATAVLGSETLETLNGATIGVDGTTLVDQTPSIADPNIVQTDINASNGIAHAIDGVLLPVDLGAEEPEEPIEEDTDDGGSDFGEVLAGLGLLGALLFGLTAMG